MQIQLLKLGMAHQICGYQLRPLGDAQDRAWAFRVQAIDASYEIKIATPYTVGRNAR